MAMNGPRQLRRWLRRRARSESTRNLALFFLGAAVFIHEAFFTSGDRQWIIFGGITLMGLPVVLPSERDDIEDNPVPRRRVDGHGDEDDRRRDERDR